jgi:cation:H+ antiporter
MLLNIILLVIGLVILIVGGDFLVRGASRIAIRFHISPLVIGLTIVAFGTSAPELLIALKSALAGSPDLTMGNIVGSNICNLALVLGVAAIIGSIRVKPSVLELDWPVAMGSSLLLYILMKDGWISWHEGLLFIAILAIYTIFIIRNSMKEGKALRIMDSEFDPPEPKQSAWKDVFLIIIGSFGLYFGADLFIGGAQELARFLGVSERVIGITVLAIGTSLPELVTVMLAAFKKETDLALGNLLGSNIFNVLSILGITSIVTEIRVNEVIRGSDMLWMLGITALVLPMMVYKRTITKIDGMILLSIYAYYTYSVVSN